MHVSRVTRPNVHVHMFARRCVRVKRSFPELHLHRQGQRQGTDDYRRGACGRARAQGFKPSPPLGPRRDLLTPPLSSEPSIGRPSAFTFAFLVALVRISPTICQLLIVSSHSLGCPARARALRCLLLSPPTAEASWRYLSASPLNWHSSTL